MDLLEYSVLRLSAAFFIPFALYMIVKTARRPDTMERYAWGITALSLVALTWLLNGYLNENSQLLVPCGLYFLAFVPYWGRPITSHWLAIEHETCRWPFCTWAQQFSFSQVPWYRVSFNLWTRKISLNCFCLPIKSSIWLGTYSAIKCWPFLYFPFIFWAMQLPLWQEQGIGNSFS